MPELAPLLTPDRHELVELVRDLHSQASPWVPSGLGNHLHWGPQPQIQSSVLSLFAPMRPCGECKGKQKVSNRHRHFHDTVECGCLGCLGGELRVAHGTVQPLRERHAAHLTKGKGGRGR